MGVFDWAIFETTSIPENIQKLAQERQEAKKNKDFSRADAIRKEVENAGYTITDSKDGPIIEKK
jgi:cysteinyl-tRNA synthetase